MSKTIQSNEITFPTEILYPNNKIHTVLSQLIAEIYKVPSEKGVCFGIEQLFFRIWKENKVDGCTLITKTMESLVKNIDNFKKNLRNFNENSGFFQLEKGELEDFEKKSLEKKDFLKKLALLDEIAFSQNPLYFYPSIYKTPFSQDENKKELQQLFSSNTQQDENIFKFKSAGIYSYNEMFSLLNFIEKEYCQKKDGIFLSLKGEDHIISLVYFPEQEAWSLIDPNFIFFHQKTSHLTSQKASYYFLTYTLNDIQTLVDAIFTCFKTKKNMFLGINWEINIKNQNEITKNNLIPYTEYKRKLEGVLKNIHDITTSNVKRETNNASNLAWFLSRHYISDNRLSTFKTLNLNALNQVNKSGISPLYMALEHNNLSAFFYICAALEKANLTQKIVTSGEVDLLYVAIAFMRNSAIYYLANLTDEIGNYSVDLNKKLGQTKLTSLHFCCYTNNVAAIKFFSTLYNSRGELRVNFNEMNSKYGTPLQMAIAQENTNTFKLLCGLRDKKGSPLCDLNLPDETGLYPIHMAALLGREDFLLHLANQKNERKEYLVNFDAVDAKGMHLLHIAVERKNLTFLSFLLNLKRDNGSYCIKNLFIKNKLNLTALDLAKESKSSACIAILKEAISLRKKVAEKEKRENKTQQYEVLNNFFHLFQLPNQEQKKNLSKSVLN